MSETAVESAPEYGDEQAEQMLAEAAAQPDHDEPQEQAQAEPDTGDKAEADLKAEISKWKSMARKHETTAKQNAEAARKYAEFEESQKTEQQRLADRLAAAEQRATQAEIGRARLVAAAAHGIPSSLLDRIGGSSEEEINESAQALASEIDEEVARRIAAMPAPPVPDPPAPTPSTYRPVEALTPGAMPANGEPVDGNEFLRRMAGR